MVVIVGVAVIVRVPVMVAVVVGVAVRVMVALVVSVEVRVMVALVVNVAVRVRVGVEVLVKEAVGEFVTKVVALGLRVTLGVWVELAVALGVKEAAPGVLLGVLEGVGVFVAVAARERLESLKGLRFPSPIAARTLVVAGPTTFSGVAPARELEAKTSRKASPRLFASGTRRCRFIAPRFYGGEST